MAKRELTAEQYKTLVKKVAERVWKQLRDELRIEKERRPKRDGSR